MERRTLVRLLVALGIGLPILIEAATFAGLFQSRVIGGDGAATPTETPAADAVAVGEELLPETAPAETVVESAVTEVDGERRYVLSVEVENGAEVAYELRLDALTTDAGTTVTGGGRSDRIGPGGSETVTGEWELPSGEEPATVIVVATIDPGGESRTVTRRVDVAVE